MENIYDFGRVSYNAADPARKLTFFEKFLFILDLLVDIIKVIVLSVPRWLTAIRHLVVPPTKKSVSGQTVLVTGGGNGIGKAIAIRFAGEGCNIAIADIDFKAAQNSAKELNDMNVVARAYHVDITNTEDIQKLKVDVEADIGPVDILVNNAGIVPMLSLREGTAKDVERIINVNVTGQFHMTRTFLPGMIKRKRGHIVGMSSMSALHPMGGAVIYSATKAAMQNFLIALSEELRQEGNDCIKCTSILPYIATTRKDIIDAANFRFPLISPIYVAQVAVDAILRDQLMATVPTSFSWLNPSINLLPFSIQMLIRDRILGEKGKRLFSEDNKKKL